MTSKNPKEIRHQFRANSLIRPTAGMAAGYTQANVVILPKNLALDFFIFCQRNPKPCPVLEVLEPGNYEPSLTAPGADIRTDVPIYRIYREGQLVTEAEDVISYWNDEMVSFLLGCSFTFESALLQAGIPLKHIAENKKVSMFVTNIPTVAAGQFSGPMVVTMRPIAARQLVQAVQITSRFPMVHGAPIHIGNPSQIGIENIHDPQYGDPVTIEEGEVPVFWACGVTPQAIALEFRPSLMITHSPGYMFITNIRDQDLSSC
jgi:uncharacterized protein YcsI (UPF0317 family)